ncbi:response regulator [Mucilaginibacter achroorhodeus]|uniref:Response regulator n=1 Tax=Mucilaginibacter achroorhodeus TaxID=2599294 RepID=A0A563U913_9SPHI|nr:MULTISPECIES: response regulator [Mucilaginibacter]QXV67217.1 response regulator [Mucilaginibacter sp. 21P]TWR27816.1 response regulator [Mucilaginibacter achroorhodeus]
MWRILAVDDDNDILDILQFILEDSGYKVDTLSDGNKFMDAVNENNPDLILLDVMLGNCDGRDLCKQLKKLEQTHNIPVVMISASHNSGNTINGEDGPDEFVAKPFDINDLLGTIEKQLSLRAA